MARLFEHQAKELLRKEGIKIPNGIVFSKDDLISEKISTLPNNLVLKAQTWTKERKKAGGVLFCENKGEIEKLCNKIFDINFGNFKATKILIEEKFIFV